MNTPEPMSRDFDESQSNIKTCFIAIIIDPLTIDNEKINDDEYFKELLKEKINIINSLRKEKIAVGLKFHFLINDSLVQIEITSEEPVDFKIDDERLTSDKYTILDGIGETNEDLVPLSLVSIN